MSAVIDFIEYLTKSSKPTIGDVTKAIDHAIKATHAYELGVFSMGGSGIENAKKLNTARQRMSSIKGMLSKVDEISKYAFATRDLVVAVKKLKNPDDIRKNPEEYGRAFDNMFHAFGTFAQLLPPPADAYGVFLLGFSDFFGHLGGGVLNMNGRGTSNRRYLHQIIEEDDAQWRPKK